MRASLPSWNSWFPMFLVLACAAGWSQPAKWSMGLLRPEDWTAQWISHRDTAPLHKDRNALFLPPRGRIVSRWKQSPEQFELTVTIPANTTVMVFMPQAANAQLTESGKPLDQVEGIKLLGTKGGRAILSVDSGTYHFASSTTQR